MILNKSHSIKQKQLTAPLIYSSAQ